MAMDLDESLSPVRREAIDKIRDFDRDTLGASWAPFERTATDLSARPLAGSTIWRKSRSDWRVGTVAPPLWDGLSRAMTTLCGLASSQPLCEPGRAGFSLSFSGASRSLPLGEVPALSM